MAEPNRSLSLDNEEAFIESGSPHDSRLSSSTLNEIVRQEQEQEQERGQDIVDFDENGLDDPLQWPYWRKLSIQLLVACMFMLGIFGTIIIVPAVPQILEEFHVTSAFYSILVVSIWDLGEVFGPFLAAPLSERFGRLPVFHIGNVLFLVFSVASALSTNIHILVALRFLNGFTTTSMTLGPGIVRDCFPLEQRGASIAVALAIPQVGPFAAPVIGGYLAEGLGWRWCVWFVTILAGAMIIVSFFVVKETYRPVLLEKNARKLRAETGNTALKSRCHDHWGKDSFWKSVLRPVRLLMSSPIVFLLSVYNGLSFGMNYVILTILSSVMQSQYGFSTSQTGLALLARGLGTIVGMLIYGLTSDRYLRWMQKRRNGQCKPEDRLPHTILGSTSMIAGILIYGWGAYFHAHWIVPIIGASTLLTILATQNYLVDVFDVYAASAVAASNSVSAVFSTFFPLCVPPLYERLGLGWGNPLLALLFVVWLPVLFGLHWFGERIRTSARFGIQSTYRTCDRHCSAWHMR